MFTDVPESRLLQGLKIGKELCSRRRNLAGPILMNELDVMRLDFLALGSVFVLLLYKDFPHVILVFDFLHCFDGILRFDDVKVFIWSFLEEIRDRVFSRWDESISAELENTLQDKK